MVIEGEPVEPSEQQVENCAIMGWEYLGDGIFMRKEMLGWFTENDGFKKH